MSSAASEEKRRWWDYVIVAGGDGGLRRAWLRAAVPPLAMDLRWVAGLSAALLLSLAIGGWSLYRRTRF